MKTDKTPRCPEEWTELVYDAIDAEDDSLALSLAEQGLERHPSDPELLSTAAWMAAMQEKPALCRRYLHRLKKRYAPVPRDIVMLAIASAQQGNWAGAKDLLDRERISATYCVHLFPPGFSRDWGRDWMKSILSWTPDDPDVQRRKQADASSARKTGKRERAADKQAKQTAAVQPSTPAVDVKPLPMPAARIPIGFELPEQDQYSFIMGDGAADIESFNLRMDIARLALLKGFDELLCLSQLSGIEHYWYQIETVRKVLKQFRGRVLLADEVGLGKTIEAGMVLKEYLLRGMVERVLILTPASLVGQWREEMESKFGILFSTTHDTLAHRDARAFWNQPRIVASIAAARRQPHYDMVTGGHFDMVIVDEAHHLKNRATQNWRLTDALKKRFLLLLSATPVQNNLIELYNLLTLLKPGIFKTEKEFRSLFVASGNPRLPANRERLRDLMRDVMIRNTRSLVDVRLPPRQAITIPVVPSLPEQECYGELSRLIRGLGVEGTAHHHFSLHHILEAAGSSPVACAAALERFLTSCLASETPEAVPYAEWDKLRLRYADMGGGAKADALLGLLAKNPAEKKMVFVRLRETMAMLDETLRRENIAFARFDGHMTGPEKDRAIEDFRVGPNALLCSESGGEGRNLQFCNTVINFDLPWNPQLIEQRIGRVHRIGQEREVFVFNMVARHTIEDRILGILDEKINMFELVVGEIQSILGEMEDEHDFGHMVFKAWIEETETGREKAFADIEDKLLGARKQYEEVKSLDDALFGEEFEVG